MDTFELFIKEIRDSQYIGMGKIPTAKIEIFVSRGLTTSFILFFNDSYWFEYIHFAYSLLIYVQNFHHESHHDLAPYLIMLKKLDSYCFPEASSLEEVGNSQINICNTHTHIGMSVCISESIDECCAEKN